MNIVLAAGESAGVEMLRVLARSKHRVVGVLATSPQKGTAGSSVWNVAQQLGYETWPGERLKDPGFAQPVRAQQVDLLLNVHSLHIIHEEVLSAPKIGSFNLHPGPLPRYAGLNPVSWAIFNGEKEHGVSVHRMEAGVDAGPIAFQSTFPIDKDESALSLSLKCMREGMTLMSRLLQAAETDSIPALPQDLAQRRYFGREVPENGQLSWSWPAEKVINFVRACDYFPFDSPWGHPRTCLGVQEFALVKASRTGRPCQSKPGTLGESTDSGVYVACQDEWILVNKLRVEGRCLPAVGFLRNGGKPRIVSQEDDERGSAEHSRTTDHAVCGDAGGSTLGSNRPV
jgi:methionyl-tRNA formyltransferase